MSCLQLEKPVINVFRKLSLNSIIKSTNPTIAITKNASTTTNSISPCPYPFSKKPCKIKFRTKPVGQRPQYAFKRMWENPRCCVICQKSQTQIRHDIHYLKEDVDWTQRHFQRTWFICPDRTTQQNECKAIKLPPYEYRPRGCGNPDAKWCRNFKECKNIKPTCYMRTIIKPCCHKRCALYPSYSECFKKCITPPRPSACGCLYNGGLCAINEYAKKFA